MSSLLTALVRKALLQQAPGNHTFHLQVLLQRHSRDAHPSWHRPTAPLPTEMVQHAAHPLWQKVRHSGHLQISSWLKREAALAASAENGSLSSPLLDTGRRLSFWSFIPNLEDYTLTFLDLVIQHPPQGFHPISPHASYPIPSPPTPSRPTTFQSCSVVFMPCVSTK